MHCSCYGSEEAVLGGDYLDSPQATSFESINWDWQGKPDKFAELAENSRDYKFPRRTLDRHDSDYTFVKKVYQQDTKAYYKRRIPSTPMIDSC